MNKHIHIPILIITAALGGYMLFTRMHRTIQPVAAPIQSDSATHITELRSADDLAQFVAAHQLAIIKCSAEWCPPCKMMKPIFEEAALQHSDKIAFGHADSEEGAALHDTLGIQGVPTFICYKNGAETFRFVSYKPAEAFETELQKLLAQ